MFLVAADLLADDEQPHDEDGDNQQDEPRAETPRPQQQREPRARVARPDPEDAERRDANREPRVLVLV
jgi:hypothetical protein